MCGSYKFEVVYGWVFIRSFTVRRKVRRSHTRFTFHLRQWQCCYSTHRPAHVTVLFWMCCALFGYVLNKIDLFCRCHSLFTCSSVRCASCWSSFRSIRCQNSVALALRCWSAVSPAISFWINFVIGWYSWQRLIVCFWFFDLLSYSRIVGSHNKNHNIAGRIADVCQKLLIVVPDEPKSNALVSRTAR